ncbi:MAG: pilus assembly protein [Gammaproteobacteria bacterium]|nr:pilus assembly protein [Gammaproteobacteria bacterium]
MRQMVMPRSQGGALLIEILITIVIVVIGTLGLMQMQGRLQKSEMEAYQRTQAMILLNDMASRIASNRLAAANYDSDLLDPKYLGGTTADLDCSALDKSSLEGSDLAEWCDALQGAAELQSGSSVGAMVGGRGCVQPVSADRVMVTVVWQGLTPISAPPATVSCGVDLYDVAGTDCADDLCRRYVTTMVSIANLDT